MARETTVTGRRGSLRGPAASVIHRRGVFGGRGEHWHLKRDVKGRFRSTSQENPTRRVVWVAALAGTAALLIGGIALASGKQQPTPQQCTSWRKLTSGGEAEKMLTTLNQQCNVDLNSVPPGVHYYSCAGQQIRFVNNMDGSLGNKYPDTPAGNTSIYVCQG